MLDAETALALAGIGLVIAAAWSLLGWEAAAILAGIVLVAAGPGFQAVAVAAWRGAVPLAKSAQSREDAP